MNRAEDQMWIDLLKGMENKAMYRMKDDDPDRRNRNWYARKVYGDTYQAIRNEYQERKMEDIRAKDLSMDIPNSNP